MEASVDRRRRILLHFVLGIGLPSLLLGYLAFRGIRNDTALLEKERLGKHQGISQRIIDSISDEISAVEAVFLHTLTDDPPAQPDPNLLRSLDRLKSQTPIIEEIFWLDHAERVQLPLASLLFYRDGSATPFHPQTPSTALLLGQQYEFQEKRYQEALASYQQVFAQASEREGKVAALCAIARVQHKLDLLADAVTSYEILQRDYTDIRMADGLPVGLMARLELMTLFSALEDSRSAGLTLIACYQDVINRQWPLSQSQYEFMIQRMEASLNTVDLQDPPSQSY